LWAAVFGFLVVESDVRTRRIPNTLTALGLVVALAVAFVAHGWAGVGLAVLGAGLALGILFPFFAFRALGAGDVKAMMVLGALIGPLVLVELLPWTALAGGVLAVATAARYGLLLGILRRWAGSIMTSIALRRVVLMSPEKPLTVRGVPFGVAIIWGASAHQLWGALWQ
jgi:prepilin peptidase CpaA